MRRDVARCGLSTLYAWPSTARTSLHESSPTHATCSSASTARTSSNDRFGARAFRGWWAACPGVLGFNPIHVRRRRRKKREMPIDLAEAQRRLAADPINVDAETRATLTAHHGEEGFRKLRYETTRNVAGSIRATATGTPLYSGSAVTVQRPQEPYRQATPAPSQPGSAENTLERAEQEFYSNPVGASRGTRELLRTRWGDAEYGRRLKEALRVSGQDRMKVTPK